MAIPDREDFGFNQLVAARLSEPGNRVGVWMLGSDGGAVQGVNMAGQAYNHSDDINPGSVAAGAIHLVTALPEYRAVVACASR